jgi:hypothetical protein
MTVFQTVFCIVILGMLLCYWKVDSARLRCVIVLLCIAAVSYSQLRLGPLIRYVVSTKHAKGEWTRAYSEGAIDMADAVRKDRPTTIVAVITLGFLGMQLRKRQNAGKIDSNGRGD